VAAVEKKLMKIEVRKLCEATKNDFYKVNCESNGLGWCNCVAWWCPTWDEFKDRTEAQNRIQREDLFARGEFDGYVLYADGVAIGWSQVGARDRLTKLCSQYDLKPSPASHAITCFSIAPAYRGKGISHIFIKEILQDLKSRGIRHVEGFPKRNTKDPWTGTESTFAKAGFKLEKDAPNLPIYGMNLE
jgi:GNAT superfamily N-acetyltransferase